MPDVSLYDFLPLFPEETEEAVRARWRAWANEGLTPENVEEWTDVREGSFWYIATAPGIQEAARIYDLMGTEFPAAGFPVWAWGDYLDDHGATVRLERLAAVAAEGEVTFSGTDGIIIGAGTVVAVEPTTAEEEPREYEVQTGGTIAGGEITLPVTATTPGSGGNAAAGAVTLPVSALPGVTSISNADPIVGGTDPETDEALRERLLAAYEGRGPGTQRDYEVWARAYGGVGRATVVPLWNGPGTVLVIALTADGDPVSATVVDGLQGLLDPVAGTGAGDAPVGPTVTVTTAVAVNVDVDATVELEGGYSLDGAGGTVDLTAAITAAVRPYLEGVQPGSEIVLAQVAARIITVPGVHDVGGVELDGSPANLTLTSDPAQVANLGTLGLTSGSL